MAAPLGNQYAAKSKQWTLAIERALEKRKTTRAEALDELAEKLLNLCSESDLAALKELGDRLEGKPGQAIDLGSDPERPMIQKLIREIVRTKD
jgi:hypothetical protein